MAINSNILPNGFGQSTGDSLVITEPWYTTESPLYVDSVNGSDSNDGTEEQQAKATLVSAMASVGAYGVIVLSAAHDETLTSTLATTQDGITIAAAGNSGGQPTAQLKRNFASGALLDIHHDNVQIRNVKFPTNVQTNTVEKIRVGRPSGEGSITADDVTFINCRFECTVLDDTSVVSIEDGLRTRFESGTTFIATGASGTGAPIDALLVNDAATTGMLLKDVIFDGGVTGFEEYGFNGGSSTITNFIVENVSLLRGADMNVVAASSGRINIATATGSGRVVFV